MFAATNVETYKVTVEGKKLRDGNKTERGTNW